MNKLRKTLLSYAKPVNTLDDKSYLKAFFIPANFEIFDGHFPEKPILPAVLQILMTEISISEAMGKNFVIQEMLQAKFTSPIMPDSHIECSVKNKNENQWDCTITAQGILAAKFSMRGEYI